MGLGLAVKVPRSGAEEARRRLAGLGLLDRSRRIMRNGEFVYIPVTRPVELGFEVVSVSLPVAEPKAPMFRASYDVVGSVAIVNDMDMDVENARRLAELIMARHRRVRTVLQKVGEVSGVERVASFRVLAGDGVTETVYRESGCVYKLDVARVFFSPRLSTERLRVAAQVGENESVLDMFAGVGPFSILIARRHPSTTIYAVEKNHAACSYLLENIKLNKVEKQVKPFCGDAAEIVPQLDKQFNRVIMNLPHQSLKYLPLALSKCVSGAVIHLYVAEEREGGESVWERIKSVYAGLLLRETRVVKEISPRMVIRVYDLVMG
ncbi:MAG: class I SAM-dependent methyltransferase family protein [Candidatus Caldarchaeum sp.]